MAQFISGEKDWLLNDDVKFEQAFRKFLDDYVPIDNLNVRCHGKDGIFIVCFHGEHWGNYPSCLYFVERAAKLFHKVNTGFLKPADVI